jgi:hypothetical protein
MYKGEGKGRVDLTQPPHMRLTRPPHGRQLSLFIYTGYVPGNGHSVNLVSTVFNDMLYMFFNEDRIGLSVSSLKDDHDNKILTVWVML